MSANYDVAIIGCGEAGIFAGYELKKLRPELNVLVMDQGADIYTRQCPIVSGKVDRCVHCSICDTMCGFGGAGAFSDGKFNFTTAFGGWLTDYMPASEVMDLIRYVDSVNVRFGATTECFSTATPEAQALEKKALENDLHLLQAQCKHLGTENNLRILANIYEHLKDKIDYRFRTAVKTIDQQDEGYHLELENGDSVDCAVLIAAPGRSGAEWFAGECKRLGIHLINNQVDIGVRVEVRNEVMENVNNVLYESKLIGYPHPFKNKVRTFCQNPGGFVSQENYDNHLAVVNGHSYKERKSENTNLAILCTHNFLEPFNQPIAYAKKIGELCNALGAGHILVQRFGDILDGKRTWQKELSRSNVRPTLPDAVAGDVTAALPYRTMTSIINFMLAVDEAIPGFASAETLLYAPELKFYSNRVKMDANFDTNIASLHCLGDSSGWTRGLMMASVMGCLMGERLASGA